MTRLARALLSTDGRLGREGWWNRLALVGALFLAQGALSGDASLDLFADLLGRRPATLALVWGGVAALWILGVWILVAASLRRLRDRGRPAAYLVAFAVPTAVAAHWLETHWGAWIGFLAALSWGVIELGVLPSEPPRAFETDRRHVD